MDAHLRSLRYFLAVADELHFTRAAQRLFVSQPALSRQIRALEQHVRTPLFERGPSGVRLTAAGHALVPYVRRIVADWDSSREAVAQATADSARSLVVGLTVSVGRGLLPAATETFLEQHPGFRVDLHQLTFDDPTVGLAERLTDVAFSWLPLPRDAGIRHSVLFTEPRQVALPTGHRLTGHAELTMADLLDEPFLALPDSAGPRRDFWLAVDQRGGRPPRVAAVVHGPEDVIEALGRGVGIALIAQGNAQIYRRPEFVVRPVRGLPPGELAIVWREGDRRPEVHDFVQACVVTAAGLQGRPGAA